MYVVRGGLSTWSSEKYFTFSLNKIFEVENYFSFLRGDEGPEDNTVAIAVT